MIKVSNLCFASAKQAIIDIDTLRVAAARAMLGSPEIIIANEPTSALDKVHRQSFIQILFDECEKSNITLIFVSHDGALKQHCTRQIMLQQLN